MPKSTYVIYAVSYEKKSGVWQYYVKKDGEVDFAGTHAECVQRVLERAKPFDNVSDSTLPFIHALKLKWSHFVCGLVDYLGDGSTVKSRIGWGLYRMLLRTTQLRRARA